MEEEEGDHVGGAESVKENLEGSDAESGPDVKGPRTEDYGKTTSLVVRTRECQKA